MDDPLSGRAQELAKRADVQLVMPRLKLGQVAFGQMKETNGRTQTPPMFRMGGVLKILLQMHKSAGRLDQPFKEIGVPPIHLQPNVLKNIVRLVVMLIVPTPEIGPVKGVALERDSGQIDLFSPFQLAHKLRNPFAFAHEVLNLGAAPRMSKPSINFPEDKRSRSRHRTKE